ncbi:MAG: hypothetical protein FWC61_00350, partial [Proteobacteria bacterium]|nr:hypothetical protein [Pseudomonadota bacterium]
GSYSAGGTATGCTTCPKDSYCVAGSSAPTACSTVGSGYITDSTGATSSAQCHSSVLTMQDMICYNASTTGTISYTGGTVAMTCDQGVSNYIYPQPIGATLSGYYVTGTCSTMATPAGCTGPGSSNWNSACIGSPTYSASGTYCWCRLQRVSDGKLGAKYVIEGPRSPASTCASICAQSCAGYAGVSALGTNGNYWYYTPVGMDTMLVQAF